MRTNDKLDWLCRTILSAETSDMPITTTNIIYNKMYDKHVYRIYPFKIFCDHTANGNMRRFQQDEEDYMKEKSKNHLSRTFYLRLDKIVRGEDYVAFQLESVKMSLYSFYRNGQDKAGKSEGK